MLQRAKDVANRIIFSAAIGITGGNIAHADDGDGNIISQYLNQKSKDAVVAQVGIKLSPKDQERAKVAEEMATNIVGEVVPPAEASINPNPISPNILPEHQQFASPERIYGQEIWVPIEVKGNSGSMETLNLKATLYIPEGEGPFPLMIYNHGGLRDESWVDEEEILRPVFGVSRDLVDNRKYAIIAPMSRGRGGSGGDIGYSSQHKCASSDEWSGKRLEDIEGTIKYIGGFSRIDTSQILLMGHSRGGSLAVAYAEKHPKNVIGYVNFGGSWWDKNEDKNRECIRFNNSIMKRDKNSELGDTESLWVYGKQDKIVTAWMGKRYYKKYKKKGGNATLLLTNEDHGSVFEKYASYKNALDDYLNRIEQR